MTKPRLTSLAAALAVVLLACAGGTPAAPPTADVPPSPAVMTPTPDAPAPVTQPPGQPTPEPGQASPSPVTPEPAGPSGPVLGPGETLLDYLPESIMGETYETELFTYEELLEEWSDDEEELARLLAFLADIGRSPADVQQAAAFAIIDDESFVQITALHARELPLGQLLQAAIDVAVADIDDIEDVSPVVYEATIGGKPVTVVELDDAYPDDERAYFYGTGEIVYQVDTIPELAEIVLADLP